jgi:putative transposase
MAIVDLTAIVGRLYQTPGTKMPFHRNGLQRKEKTPRPGVWHRRPTIDRRNETPYNRAAENELKLMSRPPRIPNWLRWENATVYFITICVENRKPVLANPRAWELCLEIFRRLDRWTILAAIAMPDHLHLLAAPQDRDASVGAFSKWFKRWFNEGYHRDCRASVSDAIWQEGCFDRLLRSEESLSEKWEYLRQNPVRAGLVQAPEEWPYQFGLGESGL